MKSKFIIFSPSYSENNGGAVTLHHLCHLLNLIGHESYLYPSFDNFETNLLNYKQVLPKFYKKLFRQPLRILKTSNRFNTPVLKKFSKNFNLDEFIIIYPEIVFGNPLGAKNVVRWLLHNPGFFTNKIYYGPNEIYFKYSNGYNNFNFLNSKTSSLILYIFTYLKHYYNENEWFNDRSGIAYCIRKGNISTIPLDLEGAILIDGMKHAEISKVFKKVKYFISFDPHTAFSRFAALCGCISIVVPTEGKSVQSWQPDIDKRFGISYGFETTSIEESILSRKNLKDQLIKEENNSIEVVREFVNEVEQFFHLSLK